MGCWWWVIAQPFPLPSPATHHPSPTERREDDAMNVALPKAAPRVKWRQLSSREKRSFFQGLLFVSPWLIGFLALTVYPLVFSFYISLTRYDLIRPPVFIGLANYQELFFDDPVFWQVVFNTLYYVIFSVPLSLIFAFCVANLLNSDKIVGRSFFRAIMYIPSIVPAVATAM